MIRVISEDVIVGLVDDVYLIELGVFFKFILVKNSHFKLKQTKIEI